MVGCILNKIMENNNGSFVHRWPVFYGWIIMVAGSLGLVMTSPAQTYTVSIFIEHFIEDLSINRTMVSALYTGGTLIGSLTLPLWGRLVDRKGSRWAVTIIAILFGLACIYMGWVQNAFMLGIGFISIRMLGQGSLSLVSQNVINQWWIRNRGLVMGISGSILAVFGMGLFPNLVHMLVATFGWRMAYPILGLALIFVMAPLGLIFFRNRPEEFGLTPDNANLARQESNLQQIPLEEDWTLKQALHTGVFWIVLVSVAAFTMITTGLFFHMVSIFEDQGLSASVAASVFAPIAISAALANLASGIGLDRIPVKVFLFFGLLIQALSLLLVVYLGGVYSAFLFGILLGITNGVFRAISTVVWPKFYGRGNLGSIYGVTTASGVLGASLGPLPFGVVRDISGTYQPTLYIFAALSVLLGLISLGVKKPVFKTKS
jgi:MFS transporter, OFA family, oxalate/formate antiporter